MTHEWKDIKDIEQYREHYEFSDYAVLVDDGDGGTYTDIAFGINLIPSETKRFCLIPEDA